MVPASPPQLSVKVPASPLRVSAQEPPSGVFMPFLPFMPFGIVTEVPSVQLTVAPASLSTIEQEVPLVPAGPCPPLLPEQPAASATASAAKGNTAFDRLVFMNSPRLSTSLVHLRLLMAASACSRRHPGPVCCRRAARPCNRSCAPRRRGRCDRADN